MESDNSISERLLQFIQYLGLNLSSFAYNCGTQEKLLLNLKEGYSSAFRKISKVYPQLNIRWLKYGEGNMINEPTSKHSRIRHHKNRPVNQPKGLEVKIKHGTRSDLTIYKEPYPIKNRLNIFIKHLGISSNRFMGSLNLSVSGIVLDTIDKSEFAPVICEIICEKYPELNYKWLLHGKGNMLKFHRCDSNIASQNGLSKKMDAAIPAESIKQVAVTPENNIMANNNHLCNGRTATSDKRIDIKESISWIRILKIIAVGIGAIAGIFLVVWVIAEFVFPAVFIGLLFLSMLFAKK